MTDLRFALRQLRKSPGFTLTALATVAICLGTNLAIFAVINSVLLRPLPFPLPASSPRAAPPRSIQWSHSEPND